MNTFNKQSGMTLIELIVVIAVGAIIVAGTFALVPLVMGGSENQSEIRNISVVTSGITTAFENENTYADLDDAYVIGASFLPETYKFNAAGTEVRHRLGNGGSVTFAPATISVANDAFSITYDNVPSDSCQSIVQALYNRFNEVTVDGAAISGPADITSNCADGVAIVFTRL